MQVIVRDSAVRAWDSEQSASLPTAFGIHASSTPWSDDAWNLPSERHPVSTSKLIGDHHENYCKPLARIFCLQSRNYYFPTLLETAQTL